MYFKNWYNINIGIVLGLYALLAAGVIWLPHYKEVQLMSFRQRTNIVIILAVASLVLIFEHVVSVPTNLASTFFTILSIDKGINEVKIHTEELSNRNYNIKPLKVECRCEVGELVNNINIFRETTKSLLTDMAASAQNSTNSANELKSSLSSASKNVDDISSNIEMVANINSVTKILEKNTEAVDNLAQTVRSQEGVVKNAMDEQNEGNKQVLDAIKSINDSTAVKEVANNSDKNLHDTQELIQKIETFDL